MGLFGKTKCPNCDKEVGAFSKSELLDSGAITKAEFEAKKKQLLGL